ncbi:uncharacterized protein LOC118281273 isoform X2 [Spodoptera frugiperda]|uniref:Uncharacterized protein LOC118281273 isoform X2 n=1 Tax=Spodoptera frugiperda TaxID=7108 RepID=A0A9R0EZD2_SPOFR|nr:uncharacterized protein LOC118281273 isoform X2 [Spodoptera frugiperda]
MAAKTKTILLLIVTNFILAQTQLTSEEIKTIKDSEEITDDTTTVLEEDDGRTTTEFSVTPEDGKEKEEEQESAETATEETSVDVTAPSSSNVVDDVGTIASNLSNNIETVTKTETVSMTATTRAMEEEPSPKMQETEEDDSPGQRNPKADNDPKPPLDKRTFENQPPYKPQTTRSVVRSWLQDCCVRPPAGIMVPLRAAALARALAVWSDLTVPALNLSHVLVMGYDSNGVNWRSRHNLQPSSSSSEKTVAEALSKLLLKYQGVNTDTTNDGTMRALATAAKLVPYDSALFIITDKGPGDPQRLPLALRALVEKRLKVYTIWTDPAHPSPQSEEALQELRNVSKHTEGEVMPYPLQVMMDGSANMAAETELEQWNPSDPKQGRRGRLHNDLGLEKFDLLLVRRGGGQAISLGVPVENGVTALRVFIEGAVEHAVLYPPNDAPQIDLYNTTSVAAFSSTSRTEGMSPRDVYLIFPGTKYDLDMLSVLPVSPNRPDVQAAYVGMWHLSVRCDTCDYRLMVSARTHIHFNVETDTPETLKFRVTGPVASVRESQLVDEYSTELAKLPFSYQPLTGDGQNEEMDPIVELVADVALPPVKASKVYAKIVGRDLRGEPFIRLSGPLNQPEIRMGRSASMVVSDSSNELEKLEEFDTRAYNAQLLYNQNQNTQPFSRAISQVVNQQGVVLTAVQIGLASRLYGAPGESLQLHFEVTNYREQAVRFNFGARGELRFLTGINPTSQTVTPGQTVNVIVSLIISPSAQPGLRDTITFTAYVATGGEQISISAYVYVANSAEPIDTFAPEIWHNFQGTCLGRTGDDCARHTWATTVTSRDSQSGLLRLTSSPVGIMYTSDFVSGTRQEVTATYRANCCAPRVLLNAVDAYGNTNSYIIDSSNHLTGAAIAAIVLGVLLAIALLALIIFLIVWCVRKRKSSRELPSYNTSRN